MNPCCDFPISIVLACVSDHTQGRSHWGCGVSRHQFSATPSANLHPVSFISTYFTDLLSHDVTKRPFIASTRMIEIRGLCYERTFAGEFTLLLVISFLYQLLLLNHCFARTPPQIKRRCSATSPIIYLLICMGWKLADVDAVVTAESSWQTFGMVQNECIQLNCYDCRKQ